ncbi:MAG: glycosyltransferase family 4 protein [Salinigranum sp.]
MRLAYVTSRYPPHTGGVETHVSELASRFAARGHEVTVLSADAGTRVDGVRVARSERRDGVRVRRFRGIAPGGAFHVAPGIAPAVRRVDADLVHAHNYHSLPLLFAALGTSSGLPLVATPHYHGGSASDLRDRLLGAYRPLGEWALRRARAVVAVSEWERRRLAADFGVEATVIPNGLDVARFRDAEPVERERPYLLCVGRLEAYKGVQHVVGALPALTDPPYDLLVAGAGPYGDDLRRIAREAGVGDRVSFLGYVPDEELPGLYAGASAFVTMSGFEAYGMTVAEALASGTPCVVRPAGALVDWTRRADCVAADVDEVAAGVRTAVGLAAPSDSLPAWEDVVERTGTVYEGVLDGR